ncbi:helix-turn-helix domain-containing protein [Microbacterium sp. NPDC057407]|uniref:helix-turn-helix domain-containing protein n=1 Tax=Microbacterium sp. NPDC057407 TaxID=3346120 RepID=UPI00366D03E8
MHRFPARESCAAPRLGPVPARRLPPRPRLHRRHASQPITVEDIARATSLSVAQLNHAVHEFSPTGNDTAGELRRARLVGAHRDLLTADPERGDTVRDIALRWGFAPANFARIYRSAFGATPRQTIAT